MKLISLKQIEDEISKKIADHPFTIDREEVEGYKDYINVTYSLNDSNYIHVNTLNTDNQIIKVMEEFGYTESGSGAGMGGRDISFVLE